MRRRHRRAVPRDPSPFQLLRSLLLLVLATLLITYATLVLVRLALALGS